MSTMLIVVAIVSDVAMVGGPIATAYFYRDKKWAAAHILFWWVALVFVSFMFLQASRDGTGLEYPISPLAVNILTALFWVMAASGFGVFLFWGFIKPRIKDQN